MLGMAAHVWGMHSSYMSGDTVNELGEQYGGTDGQQQNPIGMCVVGEGRGACLSRLLTYFLNPWCC